jgi:Phosphotransferase enzyme family
MTNLVRDDSQRKARLVLVTPNGVQIGCLPPIPVVTPYWQDILPVVAAARACFGINVSVLRLLKTESLGSSGGEVTYLAEVDSAFDSSALPIEPWQGELQDDALRLPYAKPGGPAADLRWAETMLQENGYQMVGKPEQIRTWNLSSIWRIPVPDKNVWLKVVPPFFGHEGSLIERLAGERVPKLIGKDGCRILLDEVPGEDLHVSDLKTLLAMVELLVGIQRGWIGRTEELASIGLPVYSVGKLSAELERLVERRADELLPNDRSALVNLISSLPVRHRRLVECGLKDTLVHGDFHPGNLRGDGTSLTLIDWGDSGIGHPMLDQSAFLERVSESDIPQISQHWANLWQHAIPRCDPQRAAELIRPMASAHRAIQYQMFLDNIEPSERIYHCSDPVDWLHQTAVDFVIELEAHPRK